MLAQAGRNQPYSSVPQSSSVPRQPSARYTDNPSYTPSQTQPRTNQSAAYGTYDSGNPFADPASHSATYYRDGPTDYSNLPEKYSPPARMFGMRRRNFIILLSVVGALLVALVVAAAVKNVSHMMSNKSSSNTNADLGDDFVHGSSSSIVSSSTTSSSLSTQSPAPTLFVGWHNSTNTTYLYPNTTVAAVTTKAPSRNVSIHFYF
ncbi:hypothetical protein V1509DRAFT_40836 [Lipomyces kononenkoae]